MWRKQFQVYIEHTDCTGVVYHAKYLHFLEMARSEVLESICAQQQMSTQEFYNHYGFFVVHNANITYRRAMRMADRGVVVSSAKITSPVRMRWQQTIQCVSSHQIYVQAEVTLAFVSQSLRPTKMPAWLQVEKMGEKI